eukprot:gene3920-biopygen4876
MTQDPNNGGNSRKLRLPAITVYSIVIGKQLRYLAPDHPLYAGMPTTGGPPACGKVTQAGTVLSAGYGGRGGSAARKVALLFRAPGASSIGGGCSSATNSRNSSERCDRGGNSRRLRGIVRGSASFSDKSSPAGPCGFRAPNLAQNNSLEEEEGEEGRRKKGEEEARRKKD